MTQKRGKKTLPDKQKILKFDTIMYKSIYHRANYRTTALTGSCEGRRECISLEQKIRNILSNQEKIDSTSPIIYTDKKDGVHAEHDIRTDRFEVALQGVDKVTNAENAKRQQNPETNPTEKKEYKEPTTATQTPTPTTKTE